METYATNRRYTGFTLVELIVVITILSILGTVAFLNLGGFQGNARDGNRVSDLANLSKWLEVSIIRNGAYPDPSSFFSVAYSGGLLWKQGTFGDAANAAIGSAGAKMSPKPVDPLTKAEYVYSVAAESKEYQLKADWEWESVAYRPFPIDEAAAATGNPAISYLKGNYNGIAVKTTTGWLIHIVSAPSIVSSQTGSGTIFELVGQLGNKSIIQGWSNQWVIFTGKLVYTGSNLPASDPEYIAFASSLADAYSGTIMASKKNQSDYIAAKNANNTAVLRNLGYNLVKLFGGWSTSTVNSGYFAGAGTISSPWTKSDGSGLASCQEYNLSATMTNTWASRWTGTCGNGTKACLSDGMYLINPPNSSAFSVYCDMSTGGGGWTVLIGNDAYSGGIFPFAPTISWASPSYASGSLKLTQGTNTVGACFGPQAMYTVLVKFPFTSAFWDYHIRYYNSQPQQIIDEGNNGVYEFFRNLYSSGYGPTNETDFNETKTLAAQTSTGTVIMLDGSSCQTQSPANYLYIRSLKVK